MLVAFWVCASILVLTQIADYYSSKVAMRNPKAQEANWIVRKLGLVPMKLAGCGLFVWVSYMLAFVNPNVGLLIGITTAITAFYTWVVLHNLNVARRT